MKMIEMMKMAKMVEIRAQRSRHLTRREGETEFIGYLYMFRTIHVSIYA